MMNSPRLIQIFVFALSLSGFCASANVEPTSDVVVMIDRQFTKDGWYTFHITEQGSGPTGSYRRTFVFKANIHRGIAVPNEFQNYEAIMTTERAGAWRTHRAPIAGYVCILFKNERPYVEFQFLEAWDGHPTKMSINGTYLLQVR
jgi:hypothetical protein